MYLKTIKHNLHYKYEEFKSKIFFKNLPEQFGKIKT